MSSSKKFDAATVLYPGTKRGSSSHSQSAGGPNPPKVQGTLVKDKKKSGKN
ncbi:hypothetical protein C1H46_045098 [Malus baccata]|uniref:Uncharacterized protein n=1 Tax=Malus baccata TaxID=106549 RepID=A0A540K558_MALBA|nr:hypothetical protein C1H46_045098 [Malus baccata]